MTEDTTIDPDLAVTVLGPNTVVRFTTASLMNTTDIERIANAVESIAGSPTLAKLVLDLTSVNYVSSRAIGMFVGLRKRLVEAQKKKFVLCGVGKTVAELLKLTGLDRVLVIKASLADALA